MQKFITVLRLQARIENTVMLVSETLLSQGNLLLDPLWSSVTQKTYSFPFTHEENFYYQEISTSFE